MRRIVLPLLAVIALASASSAQQAPEGDPVKIRGGYVSGLEYMDMDGLTKKAYVKGLIEGMLLAPGFGAPEAEMLWLYDCTAEADVDDFRAALFEHIKSRQELWPNRNPAKAYRAIRDACLMKFQEIIEGEAPAKAE